MVVERRYSKRCAVHFPVAIRYREGRPFPAKARDLSLEGMFLEVGSLILPRGTLVDLEFSTAGRSWRIAVLVVHMGARGIGVMFREPQPELYRSWLHARNGMASVVDVRAEERREIGDRPG